MDNQTRARDFLDAPKRWLSWATLGNVSHAWEQFPFNAMGVQPKAIATVCGVESPSPAAWISGPGITRCPECARIEAEALTALLDSVRREAMGECARICDAHARKHDLSFDAPAARALADRIRALATPPADAK